MVSERACAGNSVKGGRSRVALQLMVACAVACGEPATPDRSGAPEVTDAPPANEASAADAPGRWRRVPAHRLAPERDAAQLEWIERLEAPGYPAGPAPAGFCAL